MTELVDLELFGPSGRATAGLLALRVMGMVWTAPVFSARVVPLTIRTAISIVLVAVLYPMAAHDVSPAVVAGAWFTPSIVAGEVLIGMVLGLGAAIFVAAAESAGDMLAVQMGLSGANVLDPMSKTQLPVLGHLLGLFATALILSTGGHLFIIDQVAASLRLLPLGGGVDLASGAMAAVELGGVLLGLGVQFAAPVVAAMMLGNVALGVLARTVPQLNILTVAFPVQIALGLFALGVTLPMIAAHFAGWGDGYRHLTGGLMESLRPLPGGG